VVEDTSKQQERRLTWQLDQEEESRDQFKQALRGWLCNPTSRDLGEDFFVSVYDSDGCSTGLSFCVQLKSTTD
jgi:hypothetical protein